MIETTSFSGYVDVSAHGALSRVPSLCWKRGRVLQPVIRMDGNDLEMEKARLLSLALDFGFDEESAKKCLDRMIRLYGTHCLLNPRNFL